MTVRKNLAFGLKVRRTPRKGDRRAHRGGRADLGLEELLTAAARRSRAGSGSASPWGARWAGARVFLMDEPLSNLDAKLRVRVRGDLSRLHAQLGVTTVYVTHDQVEAMTLGQRAAVMNEGKIQQVDTPQALDWSPANLFVAAFIGSPSMNLVEARVADGCLRFANFSLPSPSLGPETAKLPDRVILGIRPSTSPRSTRPSRRPGRSRAR